MKAKQTDTSWTGHTFGILWLQVFGIDLILIVSFLLTILSGSHLEESSMNQNKLEENILFTTCPKNNFLSITFAT
tara:strand:+ start:453 stop:677 length:225 start_codon:yes stop_codon:yes gene_type:complete